MPSNKLALPKDTIRETVLNLTAQGKSLYEICDMPDMPTRQTIHNWLNADPAFFDQYARARLMQADYYGERVRILGEEALADKAITHEKVQSYRVAIDALKWTAGKLSGKWADRVVHQGDADNPLQVDVSLSPKQELLEYLASRSKAIGGEGDDVIDGEVVYPTSRTTQKPETKTQAVDNVGEFSSRRSSSATGSLGDKSKDGG